VVGKLIKFISNDSKAHLFKPFRQLENNYHYVGDTKRCPFMTLLCLAIIMPLFIPFVIPEAKDTNYVQKKLQNTSNRFRNYWSIQNCPKMKPLMSVGSRMQDLYCCVAKSKQVSTRKHVCERYIEGDRFCF